MERVMERVISGVFDKDGNAITKTENGEAARKPPPPPPAPKRFEEREYWAGRGLTVNNGTVLRGTMGLRFSAKETLVGLARGAILGYGFRGGLTLVFSLLKRANMRQALANATGRDSLRFATFLGLFTALYRGTNALLATGRGKDDQVNSFVAGSIAGLAIVFDDKTRRKTVSLYLLVRALDIIVRRYCRKGKIPYWEHAEAVLFGVSNMPIMYGFLFMPEILQKSYYKWILNMGNVTHNGLKITLRERRDAYFDHNQKMPFRSCQPHYHEGPCVQYTVTDWFLGLNRALKIYLPVHVLPLLIFRHKQLAKSPTGQLLHTAKALLSSCMFLSTYQFIVKITNCELRNLRQQDAGWHALLAGFLTSLSCVFERKSRISELMLYCMPRSIEATWNYMQMQGYVRPVPGWEIPLFCFTSAVLMASASSDYKSAYYKALCFVVGNRDGAFPPPKKSIRPVAATEGQAATTKNKQE